MITHRKSTDTIHIQHEPAFPDDKSRVDAGFSCDLALPPDFREALINSNFAGKNPLHPLKVQAL